jgi:hypothetical protein
MNFAWFTQNYFVHLAPRERVPSAAKRHAYVQAVAYSANIMNSRMIHAKITSVSSDCASDPSFVSFSPDVSPGICPGSIFERQPLH